MALQLKSLRSTLSSTLSHTYRHTRRKLHIQTINMYRLIEVGKMEDPNLYEQYSSGQHFLHSVFGYRGVVLFHWTAKVCNRDSSGYRISRSQWEDEGLTCRDMKTEQCIYYQVLVDDRDYPHVRTQPESVTYLADGDNKSLYLIPGLDYVSHEDILPFSANSEEPFQHEMWNQFFSNSADTLSSWQLHNTPWLEHMVVHKETTHNIRITIVPFYIGYREVHQSPLYWWRYNIRLENLSKTRVQLMQRHWRIFSSTGGLETIRGEGVIGQQPILSPKVPAFQYSSHVSLKVSSGHMWGTFRMQREDNKVFDVRIPPFVLSTHDI